MTRTLGSCLVAWIGLLVVPGQDVSGQSLTFAPTFQQSFATFEGRVADPLLGEQSFNAWGMMLGLERPGRFLQPHLWFQRYDFASSCRIGTDVGECGNDGWSLSVGPALQVVRTPMVSGRVLATVGMQGRGGGGFTGGAGFHLGLDLGRIQPSGFGQYQMIRGAHYATVGAALVVELPFGRNRAIWESGAR